jgi:uncharacterized Zn finger protein
MNVRIDLLCEVCGEDFLVPPEVYAANSCVVRCPCCGSFDLVVLGFDERVSCDLAGGAAA